MPITSINITRVSQNMRTMSMLDSLRRNTLNLFIEQNRIASGSNISAPSDDPVGASRALNLSEILERQNQILSNIQSADSFLSTTDYSISEISDLLTQAHDIASEMVNSTADQSQRDSMAELVRGMINQLVSIGNRTFHGIYLFGGQQTTRVPFTQDYGGVEYNGDTNNVTAHVDEIQDLAINLNGHDLFGVMSGRHQGYVDWNPALTEDTRLVDLQGAAGAGIGKGSIRISLSVPATTFVADLSKADTIGDVVDAINTAAANAGLIVGPGNQFNVAIDAANKGLQVTVSAGTVTIADIQGAATARDLGIRASGASTINGQDLNPLVTRMTSIDSLFGGAGAVLGSIRIENGSLSKTIDLSGAATVQDILNAINTADLKVKAEINAAGTGIDVINLMSGSEMHIGEDGGNTAELLGIRTLNGQTSLSNLNSGSGLRVVTGQADLRIVAKDGATADINLDGARTIQDVLDAINAAGIGVTATLATTGNGIRLVDTTGGAGTLKVERLNYSAAIDDLGLEGVTASGANTEIVGKDTNGIQPDSVFSALIGLLNALKSGDTSGISRAGERIYDFSTSISQVQGMVGARSQAMTIRLQYTEDAVTTTQSLLSDVKDLDYTQAVTRFQQAQTALQANLLSGSKILQLSLLDFLG